MGMIGYTMNHTEEQERSEGIATLEKREYINGHLLVRPSSVWPHPNEIIKSYHLFELVRVISRSRKLI